MAATPKISFTPEELEQFKAELTAEIMASMEAKAAEKNDSGPKTTPELEELVTVTLFKDAGDYKDDLTVSINGKNLLIQRGVPVQIPRKYALILEQSMAQDQIAAEYAMARQQEFKEAASAGAL